jgi:hypothetical protein
MNPDLRRPLHPRPTAGEMKVETPSYQDPGFLPGKIFWRGGIRASCR